MLKAIRYFYLQIVHLQKYLESKYFIFQPFDGKICNQKNGEIINFRNENLNKTQNNSVGIE